MTSQREPERLSDSRDPRDRALAALLVSARADLPSAEALHALVEQTAARATPARTAQLPRPLATRLVRALVGVGVLAGSALWLGPRVAVPEQGEARETTSTPQVAWSAAPPAGQRAARRAPGAVADAERGAQGAVAQRAESPAPSPSAEAAPWPEVSPAPLMRPTVDALAARPAAPARVHVAPRNQGAAPPAARAERRRRSGASAADELGLLTRAQQALRRAPNEALALLREHARAYPQGAYAEERAALECDALQKLGRGDDLRAAAAAFVVRYPGSPFAARIAAYLDAR